MTTALYRLKVQSSLDNVQWRDHDRISLSNLLVTMFILCTKYLYTISTNSIHLSHMERELCFLHFFSISSIFQTLVYLPFLTSPKRVYWDCIFNHLTTSLNSSTWKFSPNMKIKWRHLWVTLNPNFISQNKLIAKRFTFLFFSFTPILIDCSWRLLISELIDPKSAWENKPYIRIEPEQ